MRFRSISFLLLITTLLVAQRSFSQIEFIENKGQWDKQVVLKTDIGNGSVFLKNNGFTVLQHSEKDMEARRIKLHGRIDGTVNENIIIHSHAYAVEFINANPRPKILPDKPLETINNYFIGNDTTKWASGCKVYLGVTYKDVYPGIDIRYYSDGASRMKYDIIAYPGSDISKIALRYNGVDKLEIKDKELMIKTSVGENKELSPYSYQPTDEGRKEISSKYSVKENIVRFKIGDYDQSKILVIDPTEIFFTYSGSTADNWGFTATYGPKGSFFGGGIVFGTGFPVTLGAFQSSGIGDYDMGIMELTADGKKKIYATYIGGEGKEQPQSLFSDGAGNLVIAGRTTSTNYPTMPLGNKVGVGGKWDLVVTKLNATGSALIGSMRIGGSEDDGVNIRDKEAAVGTLSLNRNYGDDARTEVILDASNNIYVAGCTLSSNFPTINAIQSSSKGKQDAVVLKINPNCNTITWSTLLGGAGDDAAYVLALGINNNLYVAGGTGSSDLTGISSGVIQSSNAGGDCDGFILELSTNGSTILRGTYLGTNEADQIYGIQSDKKGFMYVMGTTEGSWTVLNAPYVNAGAKQFISKLKPDLSAFVYSTTFGAPNVSYPNISPTAFLVDRCENVYVSGWGGKGNLLTSYHSSTTVNMPVTPNAIKPNTDGSGSDFYFFVLKRDAASQLYGTFFGQEDPPMGRTPQTFGDHVDGGTSRFDKQGVIYQSICGNCFRTVSFVGTPGTVSPYNRATTGGRCNLGMLKIEMNFAGVNAAPRPSIDGVAYDTIGCIPLTVFFTDTLHKGTSYMWNFGDGSGDFTTLNDTISHTYTTVGTYLIREIAIDPNSCNIMDTAYLHIKAGDNKANLNFTAAKLPPCTSLSYQFTNTSQPTASFTNQSFLWDFGDGTTFTGITPPPHQYPSPGRYVVSLKLIDPNFCNFDDHVDSVIRVAIILSANFTHANGCAPYLAEFENTSQGGVTFEWDFGDGSPLFIGETPPPHLYANVGSYTVTLHAHDPETCNHDADTSFVIQVNPGPTVNFSFSPSPPRENTAIQFTNLSTGAISYVWDFGDGNTSSEVNPSHLYIETATFTTCLKATNEFGCSRDTCMPVETLITPLLEVPTAFTPDRFGINSIVKVIGFGVKQMNWNIYNRWGEKVFESHSVQDGWNGYYKGKLQPTDVYTYTLEVTFSDDKKVRRTGDITLLR